LKEKVVLEMLGQNFLILFNRRAGSLDLLIKREPVADGLPCVHLLETPMTLRLALGLIEANGALLALHLLVFSDF
jgi:hypothetical protein